ncbi:hypothetical protein P9112_002192 [Eukaryota sp. TZLM1-RC]
MGMGMGMVISHLKIGDLADSPFPTFQFSSLMNLSTQDVEELKQKFRERVKAKFTPFDRSHNNTCDEREFATIFKSLGLAPTEEETIQLLNECREDEPSSFLLYDKVEPVLVNALLDNYTQGLYSPPTNEQLLKAFQVLDPERKGFIETDVLRELLTSTGEPFRSKELEDFFGIAEEDGIIDYQAYIDKLL